MKKNLLFILCLICGCRTYNPQLIQQEYNYDTTKLSEHYHIYEADSEKTVVSPSKNKHRLVALERTTFEKDTNHVINDLLFIGTFGAATLVGIPSSAPTATCEMRATILSENKNPIKTLTARAQDREFEAMYYGYKEWYAKRKAKDVACYKARNDIFKQLETVSFDEINNLNKEDVAKSEKEKLEKKKQQQQKEEENRKKAEERRKKLTEKYGEVIANAIIKHQLVRGMSESALIESWGSPLRINSSVDSWGVHKQYIYWNPYLNDYVYVENGFVESWQTSR